MLPPTARKALQQAQNATRPFGLHLRVQSYEPVPPRFGLYLLHAENHRIPRSKIEFEVPWETHQEEGSVLLALTQRIERRLQAPDTPWCFRICWQPFLQQTTADREPTGPAESKQSAPLLSRDVQCALNAVRSVTAREKRSTFSDTEQPRILQALHHYGLARPRILTTVESLHSILENAPARSPFTEKLALTHDILRDTIPHLLPAPTTPEIRHLYRRYATIARYLQSQLTNNGYEEHNQILQLLEEEEQTLKEVPEDWRDAFSLHVFTRMHGQRSHPYRSPQPAPREHLKKSA